MNAEPQTVNTASVKFANGKIGRNVQIRCNSFDAAGSFTIGNDVTIVADRIEVGDGATIGHSTQIKAIKGVMDSLVMGDWSLIDESCNVMVPQFYCGDYTRIFRNALISGYQPVRIGHNGWFGQGAILNSADQLAIGNNVRVGANSQIWTHVASGELLEGSRFYSEAPVTIEDNVWLVGSGVMVAPGVIMREGSVVMAGGNVTKSTEAWRTYAGNPARDVTDKLSAWDRPDERKKWEMLQEFVREFVDENPGESHLIVTSETLDEVTDQLEGTLPKLIFVRYVDDWAKACASCHSIFDLSTKSYNKRRTTLEVRWHHFANGYRARFIPRLV